MRAISSFSAVLSIVLLGSLGLLTFADIIDGPGTVREERVAKTPDIPTGAGGLPRFLAETRLYIGERYALKDAFVTWNGIANLAGFRRSPAPNVALGENGFLFLSSQGAVEIAQGQDRLEDNDGALWRETFSRLDQRFADKAIEYGLVIGPNKHTIFPENLPSWVKPVPLDQTRGHDIADLAGGVFGSRFVNTRQLLTDAKRTFDPTQLYHPTDTHWTELGAALVLQPALANLGLNLPMPEYELVSLSRSGDLSRMIGQQQRWSASAPQMPRTWTCQNIEGQTIDVVTIDPIMPKRFSCGTPGGLPTKLVVFNDSFGVSAIPFLAQHFERVEFIWKDAADPEAAAQLEADIVLHIIVERKLISNDPATLLLGVQG